MAGALRKMAVYLGLVEDDRYDHRYADEYDDSRTSTSLSTSGPVGIVVPATTLETML